MPIALQGVEVKLADVRSPSRARWAPDAAGEPLVKVANNDGTLSSRRSTKAAKPTPCPARCARWSTTWSRRDQGLRAQADLVGVGYRAQAQGDKLNLSLGFSHPVVHQMPEGQG
jgi:large subunit ribosomal protein L6